MLKLATATAMALALSGCLGFGEETQGSMSSAATPLPIREDMTTQIGVNGYLWRAALDTLEALPIAQIDSAGGVILTDWFVNPDAPTERLKMMVNITDRGLRADAVKVSVSRQELVDGIWVSAPVRAETELEIEDAILIQARELRIRTLEEEENS